MASRWRVLAKMVLVLLLIGGVTTNCSWLQRMRKTPRQHWWEFWKPKNPERNLFYPQDITEPPAPPAVGGVTVPGVETVPVVEPPKVPVDVAGTIPETKGIRTPPRGMTAQLQTVFFDYDQFDLKPEAKGILDQNARFLTDNPDLKILIEGHCDERGSTEYNLALGQRRADAVREYLVSKGVPADRLQTISYGEERPVDPGRAEGAWLKNRRAQFQVF